MERTRFQYQNTQGHNSIKNIGRVITLYLYILFDDVFYLYKVSQKQKKKKKKKKNISKGFRVIEQPLFHTQIFKRVYDSFINIGRVTVLLFAAHRQVS